MVKVNLMFLRLTRALFSSCVKLSASTVRSLGNFSLSCALTLSNTVQGCCGAKVWYTVCIHLCVCVFACMHVGLCACVCVSKSMLAFDHASHATLPQLLYACVCVCACLCVCVCVCV